MLRNRRHVLALLGAAPLVRTAFAQPASFHRPLRIIVPFGAGGIADLTARTVGQALSDRIGQPVIIENKPGAGGIAAAEAVLRAQPDGHTLLLMSNGTAVSAGLFRKLPYDPVKDFAPVSLLGSFDLAIVVPDNARHKTLGELLAAARAAPGKLNLATINIGSTQHLAAELFRSTAGIDVQIVPFNGTPAVVTALRSGEVDAAVEILGPIRAQVSAQALRVLAVMGEKRSASMPDAPTVAEAGGVLEGFNVASWNALAAHAGAPRDTIVRLHRELQAVLSSAPVRQKLAGLHVDARHGTPQELAALLASEVRRWSDVITRAGIPRQ